MWQIKNYLFMQQSKNTIVLDNLFYYLLGFDTLYCDQFEPFKELVMKIKQFESVKLFQPFIQKLFTKLLKLKKHVHEIEELYVYLQEDFNTFRELDSIQSICKTIEDTNTIYNGNIFLPNKIINIFNLKNTNSLVFTHFYEKYVNFLAKEILNWINYAYPGNIIQINLLDDFYNCYWDTMFSCIYYLNIILDDEISKTILECGKRIYLIRTIYEKEINQTKLTTLTVSNIVEHNTVLKTKMHEILHIDLKNDINTMYNIILLQDTNVYYQILNNLTIYTVFSPVKEQYFLDIECIDLNNVNVEIKISKESFNVFMLKLLKSKTEINDYNDFLVQKLYIKFIPRVLQYFLGSKTFIELNILNRYLSNLFITSYFINQLNLNNHDKETNRGIKIILLILQKLKEIPINHIDHSIDIEVYQFQIKNQIRNLLDIYGLTNTHIYEIWSLFFNLCYECINLHMNQKYMATIYVKLKRILSMFTQHSFLNDKYNIYFLIRSILIKY